MGHKEPLIPVSTIFYGQEWARKSRQDPGVRFATDRSEPEKATKPRENDLLCIKSGAERTTKTREYDLLWIRAGPKEPPRPGGMICYR